MRDTAQQLRSLVCFFVQSVLFFLSYNFFVVLFNDDQIWHVIPSLQIRGLLH